MKIETDIKCEICGKEFTYVDFYTDTDKALMSVEPTHVCSDECMTVALRKFFEGGG